MNDEMTLRVVESEDSQGESDASPISDGELEALALSADPDMVLDSDAVPLSLYPEHSLLTPQWYMPPALAFGHNKWRTALVVALVAVFLLIEVSGLCSAFGQLVPA